MRNIYLTGMMGAGKTAIGKKLADLTGMDFLDLDQEIESRNHLSINEIFQKKGEPYFRSEEKKLLREASEQRNTVVATGGGIVLDPENVERMRQTGQVLYLAARFETLWPRVRDKLDRPLLKVEDPEGVFFRLFQERRPLYESSCHGRIETDGLSPEAVAQEIVEKHAQSRR